MQFINKTILFSLVVIFSVLLRSLGAEEPRTFETEEVRVLYEEPLRVGAEEAANIYPAIKRDLEEIFQWHINARPTILLIRRSETFQRMAGSKMIVAFALPRKNLVVIDYSKMKTDPFTIEATIKHEMCHLLLHHHIKNENLPKWLDEGLAQWASHGISEIIMNRERSHLKEATLAGRYIGIRSLSNRFPMDRDAISLAYEASRSFVEYIISEHGIDGIQRVLGHLKDGNDPDEAILKGLSTSIDELEGAWHEDLRKRITWVTFVINHLYEILFFIAALIMIYGFIKGFLKKRAYMREDENDGPAP